MMQFERSQREGGHKASAARYDGTAPMMSSARET